MVNVSWNGKAITLGVPNRDLQGGSYSELDRLCSKLKRRGFTIERTGVGNLRYAIPVNPKYGHPNETMQIGKIYHWPS